MEDAQTKTLLLVEDDSVTATRETRQLEDMGYRVVHVRTGEAAVDMFRHNNQHVDLVLMDIDLGDGMDGTEAASIVLRENTVPLLFLSSHTEKEIVDKTENISSYGYVVKESTITVLDASIKMAFKLFEAHRRISISEERFRLMAENVNDGLMILEKGEIVYASPAYLTILGYSEDEEIGRNEESIVNLIHPQDRFIIQVIYDAITAKERTLFYRYRARNANGLYTWREDHTTFVYNSSGELERSYIVSRVISDREHPLKAGVVNFH